MALPDSVKSELQAATVQLRLAYDSALQRAPEQAEQCGTAASAVQAILHAFASLYNNLYSDADEELAAEAVDANYVSLCQSYTRFDELSDVGKARLTTAQPVSFFGVDAASIGHAVAGAAARHIVVLSRHSRRPTYWGGSEQLRERHPEPWIDVDGLRKLRRAELKIKEPQPAGRKPKVWDRLLSALSTLHFDADRNFIKSPHLQTKIAELAGVGKSSVAESIKANLPGDEGDTSAERYQRAIATGCLERLLRHYRGEEKAFGTFGSSS